MIVLARKPSVRPIVRTERSLVTITSGPRAGEEFELSYETAQFGTAMAERGFDITDLSFDFVRTCVPVAVANEV